MAYQHAFPPALGSSAAWAGTDSETSSTGQGRRSVSRLSAQSGDSAQPSEGEADAAQVFEKASKDGLHLHELKESKDGLHLHELKASKDELEAPGLYSLDQTPGLYRAFSQRP